MGYESCATTYGPLFSPELKKIFVENNLCVPHIFEFLEEDDTVCDDKECEHNVFHECMKFGSSNTGRAIQTNTDWVKQCHGCMCLFDLVDRDLSLQDIASAMGISREMIRKYEFAALSRLQHKFKLGGGDEIVYR